MQDKLPSLFGSLREPVLAASSGEIIYRNAAALQIPGLATDSLRAILPEYALGNRSDAFLTETELASSRWMVSATELDGLTVYTFIAENPDELEPSSDILASAGVALREPISVLKFAADYLLPIAEASGDAKSREYAAMMYRGIFGIMRALNRLDAFVYKSAAPAVSEHTHFDLVRICRDLTRTVAQTLDCPHGRLTFTSNDRARMFFGDRRLIERMVLCLIGNALVFTTDVAYIEVSVREAGGRAVISVSDDGPGISNDARFDVWKRYGARRELADTKRGAGFGLSVVQSIAKLHGGGALLESRPGEGTRVVVSLPVQSEELEAIYDAAERYSTGLSMTEILTELVELVPPDRFSQRYLD
ncbi:MAG: sensor histidine kinase [Oscillospiraceae bacterium]|jgi:signal transduction histidine kinase|nr:sensor histidine kinase [Oscillospiraceae bacterium]